MPKKNSQGSTVKKSEIAYHWIKTESYQTTFVNGAIGGVTPNGKMINMAVYVERWPIPRQTVHPLEDGKVEPAELSRIQREGIVREIAVNLAFDVDTARSLVDWLKDKIEQVDNIEKDKRSKLARTAPKKKNVRPRK